MKPLINEEQNKQQKTILKKENILLRLLWVLNPRTQNTVWVWNPLPIHRH